MYSGIHGEAAHQRHLYEIHTEPQAPLIADVLSGQIVAELARLGSFSELGGGKVEIELQANREMTEWNPSLRLRQKCEGCYVVPRDEVTAREIPRPSR